ncbi:MAG: HEPN domain-containing protein [Nanoarchaeota archaeon]|nr:HEPN domain-containing protein [Nanoarchaeota archaeon]
MNSFIRTLLLENKIKIVENTENLVESYIEKSKDSLKSAELLYNNNLFDNSVSMSYYAMYHVTVALLYKYDIKCENHTGSILLLRLLGEDVLSKKLKSAKKERIDKQYYADFAATKDDSEQLLKDAKEFVGKAKSKIMMVSNFEKEEIIEKLKKIAV